jgi:hypothetical protein
MRDASERRVVEDALFTAAEALALAAARHPELDINARELGSGFRVIPPKARDELVLDLYLFDTAAGGAGYAEMAGQYISSIIDDAITWLSNCQGSCDRSCQECLRTYYNQHFQHRLDRRLGAQLLSYAIRGDIPTRASSLEQASQLRALARYLELEGYECNLATDLAGAPMILRGKGKKIAVGTRPALVQPNSMSASQWEERARQKGLQVVCLSEFDVALNLPGVQQYLEGLV